MTPDSSPGIPGWFIALFVLIGLLGVGTAIWRISLSRSMAVKAGLDPNTATAVSLLSNDGVGATYLASTLAATATPHPAPPAQAKTVEQRLQELDALRDKGLVNELEYAAQRKQILDSI